MEVKGLEQPAKPLGNSHTETNAAHKQAQLTTVPNDAAHEDQRLVDIIRAWPSLTEAARNRAYKIAIEVIRNRGV